MRSFWTGPKLYRRPEGAKDPAFLPHLQCGKRLAGIPEASHLAMFSLRLRRKNSLFEVVSTLQPIEPGPYRPERVPDEEAGRQTCNLWNTRRSPCRPLRDRPQPCRWPHEVPDQTGPRQTELLQHRRSSVPARTIVQYQLRRHGDGRATNPVRWTLSPNSDCLIPAEVSSENQTGPASNDLPASS